MTNNRNTLTLNGVETKLTDEQAEQIRQTLTVEAEPQPKEWRQKPDMGERYIFIASYRLLEHAHWDNGNVDNYRFNTGNCFPCKLFSEEQVQQIAWQNQLNSLLAQYAILNNALASEEEIKNHDRELWWIEKVDERLKVMFSYGQYPYVAKFNIRNVAQQAIKDVVKPFCRKHPELGYKVD